MTTTQYLRAFARFWLLIAACAVVGFLLPFVVSPGATTTYEAATTVVITTTSAVPPSTSDEYEATLLAHQRMATYAALADSSTFAEDVRNGASTKLTASQVRHRVTVEEVPGAVALRISAKDTDHDRAELLAAQGAKTMVKVIGRYEAAKAQPPVLLKARVAPGAARPTVAVESSGGRRPWLTGAAGLLVGLALAVALARLYPRLRDPEVVAELVNAPVLGVVPREGSAGYDRATDAVRTGIFFLREDLDSCLTVAVTGPRPVARQSRLSSDVAAALARTGARVLLVHADLDPRSNEDDAGLAGYLSGTRGLDSVIDSDPTSGVDVVRAGTPVTEGADLLHSRAFDGLLAEATQRYDFVLVTAPATSRGTGADAVAARCDVTVLVLDGNTQAQLLRESLRQLRRVDVQVRGVALLD